MRKFNTILPYVALGVFLFMSNKTLSLTPSSVSFAIGESSVSSYSHACFRYILVQRHTYAKYSIPPLYSALGEIDEERFSHYVTEVSPNRPSMSRQNKFELPYRGVEIKGYKDFILSDPIGEYENFVVEKKSTCSTSTRGSMRKGEVNPDYVAQISLYMQSEKVNSGAIIQSFYEFDYTATSLVCTEEIKYSIDFNGRNILINGRVFEYSLGDLKSWLDTAERVITQKYITPRPLQSFKSCNGCPLSSKCDQIDSNSITVDQFIDTGKYDIYNHTINFKPKIFKPKSANKAFRPKRFNRS